MTILFTKEERKWIETAEGDYGLKCKDDTPAEIRKSIEMKFESHKKWLKEQREGSD